MTGVKMKAEVSMILYWKQTLIPTLSSIEVSLLAFPVFWQTSLCSLGRGRQLFSTSKGQEDVERSSRCHACTLTKDYEKI